MPTDPKKRRDLWLVDMDGDPSEYFATREEAETFMDEAQAATRDEARSEGEWPEDTAMRLYKLVAEDTVPYLGEGETSDYERENIDHAD